MSGLEQKQAELLPAAECSAQQYPLHPPPSPAGTARASPSRVLPCLSLLPGLNVVFPGAGQVPSQAQFPGAGASPRGQGHSSSGGRAL